MPCDEASGSEDDRIFGMTYINAFILITLNMEEHNFKQWKNMFQMHCITWDVEGFLDGTVVLKGPGDKGWNKHDNLIKMWIYNTIEKPILQMVMKKCDTAKLLWKEIEDLYLSNKDAQSIQLNEDLRNTTLGDLTIEEYSYKLKVIFDLLENISQPIDEKMLVMHTINGLPKIIKLI